MLLEARNVVKRYGKLSALSGASLAVEPGEIHGVIGPNGSGKSTMLRVIAGATRVTQGEVRLAERDVTRWSATRRARAGLGIKFQAPRVFPGLSVADNLTLAGRGRMPRRGLLGSSRHPELSHTVIERLHLTGLLGATAGELSHGQQQWLEIAMALAPGPRVLLLDEPAAGMSEEERGVTSELIASLRGEIAVVIVDHDLDLIRSLCDRITVLDQGKLLAVGTPRQLEQDPRVREAYLGID